MGWRWRERSLEPSGCLKLDIWRFSGYYLTAGYTGVHTRVWGSPALMLPMPMLRRFWWTFWLNKGEGEKKGKTKLQKPSTETRGRLSQQHSKNQAVMVEWINWSHSWVNITDGLPRVWVEEKIIVWSYQENKKPSNCKDLEVAIHRCFSSYLTNLDRSRLCLGDLGKLAKSRCSKPAETYP